MATIYDPDDNSWRQQEPVEDPDINYDKEELTKIFNRYSTKLGAHAANDSNSDNAPVKKVEPKVWKHQTSVDGTFRCHDDDFINIKFSVSGIKDGQILDYDGDTRLFTASLQSEILWEYKAQFYWDNEIDDDQIVDSHIKFQDKDIVINFTHYANEDIFIGELHVPAGSLQAFEYDRYNPLKTDPKGSGAFHDRKQREG